MGRAYEVRKASMQKTNAAKSKLYAKFGKEIFIAAKSGDPDPELNTNLKRVIEKAKNKEVPTNIINRAIERAKSKEASNYIASLYEGFGPGESTVLIECLSDNANRTISEIKTCFNKTHSKLGVSGSVSFDYKNISVVTLTSISEEEVAEILFNKSIDFEDIETEDEYVSVFGPTTSLYEIKNALEEAIGEGSKIVEYEITWIANDEIILNKDEKEIFDKLVNMLEEVDDVQNVYHNVKEA